MENTTELDFELEHVTLMEEEELQKSDLPKSLRDRKHALDMMISKYKKNPTETLKESIVRTDVTLASDIDIWCDEQVELYEKSQKEKADAANAAKLAQAEAEKEKQKQNPPPPPPTPTAEEIEAKRIKDEADANAAKVAEAEKEKNDNAAKIAKMEADIKEKINSNPDNRISTADLAAIIGRQPNHPDKVGSLVLRKIYPLSYWRIG